jgi:hypothetical protein
MKWMEDFVILAKAGAVSLFPSLLFNPDALDTP